MPEEKKCFYVEIYELSEQIPCKSIEEARKTMEHEEGLDYRNIPVKLDIAEGTEADYEAHFGEEEE